MKVYTYFTSQEKSDYKIKTYTEDICSRLDITCTDSIKTTTVEVFEKIKQVHGIKRLKIKDAIVIVVISKITGHDPFKLAMHLGIANKYIYNAQKLFVEILELREFIYKQSPYKYIEEIYLRHKNGISHTNPLENTRLLIQECEKKNVLAEKTPITIGVSCLYHVLKQNYEINLVKFSKLYNVSSATILKSDKIITKHVNLAS